jgi:hypothetical protein
MSAYPLKPESNVLPARNVDSLAMLPAIRGLNRGDPLDNDQTATVRASASMQNVSTHEHGPKEPQRSDDC